MHFGMCLRAAPLDSSKSANYEMSYAEGFILHHPMGCWLRLRKSPWFQGDQGWWNIWFPLIPRCSFCASYIQIYSYRHLDVLGMCCFFLSLVETDRRHEKKTWVWVDFCMFIRRYTFSWGFFKPMKENPTDQQGFHDISSDPKVC